MNAHYNTVHASLLIYPNPIKNGIININSDYFKSNPITKINLTDISGKQIVLKNEDNLPNQSMYQINVGQLNSGIYILSVEAGTNKMQEKIIIE